MKREGEFTDFVTEAWHSHPDSSSERNVYRKIDNFYKVNWGK